MSRKLTMLFVGVVASVMFAAGVMQGCGSSSGSSDNVALCQKACDKAAGVHARRGRDRAAGAHPVQAELRDAGPDDPLL